MEEIEADSESLRLRFFLWERRARIDTTSRDRSMCSARVFAVASLSLC